LFARLLSACVLAGCVRGTRAPGEPPVLVPGGGVQSQAHGDLPSDWLEGRLPDDMSRAAPVRGGTLTVRLTAEPSSLDLLTDGDMLSQWLLSRKVYQGLARIDGSVPDAPLVPELATSWTMSDDGRVATFTLREGVRWHDGRPFGVDDVIATIRKVLDPSVRAMAWRSALSELEEVRRGDAPGTVVVSFRRPLFLGFRSLATLPVYPKHLLDAAGDLVHHPLHRAPVGTGPFRFESWDTADKRVSFVRNDDYWGRPAPLDRVVYRAVADANVAFQLLQKGEFDLFTGLTPQAWSREMAEVPSLVQDYARIRFFDVNYTWMGWNEVRPFFADARVRKAMTAAVDRPGMLRAFLDGTERQTVCHFHVESEACDPALKPRTYDLAGAARLLDEAGWVDRDGDGLREKDGVPAAFTFLTLSTSVLFGKVAPYLQQQLARVGVRMDIRKVEWAVFLDLVRHHDFDACGLAWGSVDVQQDPHGVWHSSQIAEGSNYVSYANPEADRLIDEARAELDDAKRSALFRRFGRLLYEDEPYTFLFNRPTLDAARRGLRGLKPRVGWYDLEEVGWSAEALAGTRP
jgi:peptide/nickel transport system substrate-binding protein